MYDPTYVIPPLKVEDIGVLEVPCQVEGAVAVIDEFPTRPDLGARLSTRYDEAFQNRKPSGLARQVFERLSFVATLSTLHYLQVVVTFAPSATRRCARVKYRLVPFHISSLPQLARMARP